MTENLATQKREADRCGPGPCLICLQNEALFFSMDTCSPNMIDISWNFSIHQESPVFPESGSFCSVFAVHLIS